MASNEPNKEKKKSDSIVNEDRVDDFAVEQFASMGVTTRLSDNTVEIYKQFKHNKDMLNPGRCTPESFALIKVLADMADGKLNINKASAGD